MDMWVWIPVHTTYIPIDNLLPADTRQRKGILESVSKNHNQTMPRHTLSTSFRPDHFQDTRVPSLVSRHHNHGIPLWEPWDFGSSSGHLPRSAPIDSGLAVAAVCL